MSLSFEERRDNIKNETQKITEKALSADRQARNRSREIVKKKHGFTDLSPDEQEEELKNAEDAIMAKRILAGQDANSKTTTAVDEEVVALRAIDEEEKAKMIELLGSRAKSGKKRARSEDDDDDDNETEIGIKNIFKKKMGPLVEKLERQIIAGGSLVIPGISDEELADFTKQASNPADIAAYVEKWNTEGVDLEDGLGEEEEEEDDIIVVVSDDEDDDDDDEEDLGEFIIEVEEEDDDQEEDEEENMEIDN